MADPFDASAFTSQISEAERLSRGFGRALNAALDDGVVKGRSLSDVLRGLGARLSELALSAALKPVDDVFGGLFAGLSKSLLGAVAPVATAGALAQPAALATAGATLAASTDAGAASAGQAPVAGAAPSAVQHGPVTINIATPDVEGFRRSEAQVTAALARAVSRGRRGL